jgi:hypothetical protein
MARLTNFTVSTPGPVGMGRWFPPVRGCPLLTALLLVRRRVRQRWRRGEPLLLVQLVVLIVLLEALSPPDPSLLREGRPLSLPLMRGAAGGLRSGRRWV